MALQIVEFFGRAPLDPRSTLDSSNRRCPFVDANCIKPKHGACSLRQMAGDPIIACPNRLYAEQFKPLREVAVSVFGPNAELIDPKIFRTRRKATTLTGAEVVVFGRYWGQELPLPKPKLKSGASQGSYFVDWILAQFDVSGNLAGFTAVEVQTIDTTGSYFEQSKCFFAGQPFRDNQGRQQGYSDAGMNWENVNKRILPQLIYKGHVLRREAKCTKGLFFICPKQILLRVRQRLGDNLHSYPPGNGTITFRSYELGSQKNAQGFADLVFYEEFTTTVDQVAVAFTSPVNLPALNVYEQAIAAAVHG